jgi:tRNA (guanine37-N1)-methyltransferase
MHFEILTLFPDMFTGVVDDSIIKRAQEKGLVSIGFENFRTYTADRHKTVDDYPFGGDPGMLLKPGPVSAAIKAARERQATSNPRVILMSPQGDKLDHDVLMRLLKEKSLILVCGRYKGFDQRIIDHYIDEEISIGDYILSGGELAAMVIIEALVRLIPGVLGNIESAENDSFYDGLLSPPYYTRPEEFEGLKVPEILTSGHHANIKKWMQEQAEQITKAKRPDLWEKFKKAKQ